MFLFCLVYFILLSFGRFCLVLPYTLVRGHSVEFVPRIFSCPADHLPDWQPHILLDMVEPDRLCMHVCMYVCMYYVLSIMYVCMYVCMYIY